MNMHLGTLSAENGISAPGQIEPVTVSLDVVWLGTSAIHDARMSEISMEGCFIDCRAHGRVLGDMVGFKVRLPSGPWVSLQGELVHEDYPMGFGLRFKGLGESDKRFLAQVVIAHGGDPGELQAADAAVELKPTERTSTGSRRVLIADDDSLSLRMMTAIVESEGYQVVTATDGREALGILQRDATFRAALFDMKMPHLHGVDLILYMKGDGRLRHIPVGLITAERDPKVWDDSVEAGACVFLPKPFTPPQVQMMLRMLASKASY